LCLQETGGGHLPGAASVLAQLVPCAQPEVESQTVAERFVARLLTACLRYPCANALHCATMQLMRWVTALHLMQTSCPGPSCKCPALRRHPTPCPAPSRKRPALSHHANALPCAITQVMK